VGGICEESVGMEDIEDMVGEFAGGVPLGLHLPKKDSASPPRHRDNSNAVVIKPRRRRPAMNSSGGSDVSTCVDDASNKAKVPGTQVREEFRDCKIIFCRLGCFFPF